MKKKISVKVDGKTVEKEFDLKNRRDSVGFRTNFRHSVIPDKTKRIYRKRKHKGKGDSYE